MSDRLADAAGADLPGLVKGGAVIEIPGGPSIPEGEVVFTATRGGGPGGQHVNKVATRITLSFDLGASPSLTEAQKSRIRERLGKRVSSAGILRVTASASRSQAVNREAALARFVRLLARALEEEAERRPTRPSRAAKRKRLDEKKRRGQVKARRRRPPPED